MLWETAPLGQRPEIQKNVFISPVNLTANGPAHLGHAGGPFLRMDVLSRHLKRIGHKVQTALTTDQFENHIEVQATKHCLDRDEFARANDDLIREGLKGLSISYDFFPNTGEPKVHAAFSEVAALLIASLDQSEGYVIREEDLPVDDAMPEDAPIEDRYCIGGRFGASCPSCGTPAGSYFCEQCGTHFSPTDAVEPFSRRGQINGWVASRSAYLTDGLESKLRDLWDVMAVQPEFRKIAEKYLNENGATMRLTVPCSYGIAWECDQFINRQALFSYSSLLYAHNLLCGSLAQAASGGVSPFSVDSDTVLLCSTAIDNVVPMMVGLSGTALAQNNYRPFDRIYFNKFLRLEGLKFSTSRNHVIWALEIQSYKNVNLDLLRLYLCKICPEMEETDFQLKEFVEFHNAMLSKLATCFEVCSMTLTPGSHALDEQWLTALGELYSQQADAFNDVDLRISDCVTSIEDWLDRGKTIQTSSEAATWLVGLSFLGSPALPNISANIGAWLGFDASPCTFEVGKPVNIQSYPFPMTTGGNLHLAEMERLIPSHQEANRKETVCPIQ